MFAGLKGESKFEFTPVDATDDRIHPLLLLTEPVHFELEVDPMVKVVFLFSEDITVLGKNGTGAVVITPTNGDTQGQTMCGKEINN